MRRASFVTPQTWRMSHDASPHSRWYVTRPCQNGSGRVGRTAIGNGRAAPAVVVSVADEGRGGTTVGLTVSLPAVVPVGGREAPAGRAARSARAVPSAVGHGGRGRNTSGAGRQGLYGPRRAGGLARATGRL